MKLKNLIYFVLINVNISSFGQEAFEYDFDETISLNVLEDTEEGPMPNGKYIRSVFKNETITFSSSNKAKNILPTINEDGLQKLFQGVKAGNLKSTEETLINKR